MPVVRPSHLPQTGKYANVKTAYMRGVLATARIRAGCAVCGYNAHASALDFHHFKGEKFMGVTRMLTYARERIIEEISKCVVLCKNCHAIVTTEGTKWFSPPS